MNLTSEQVDLGSVISRLVMAWIAFIAIFLTTAAFLSLLVWCLLKKQDLAAKIILGVVNSFLLSLLRIIFKHVFPDASVAKKKAKFLSKA